MKLIAHRGFVTAEMPENSLGAYLAAAKLRYDMIEVDVRQTKDKNLVAYHDVNVYRLTGKNGIVLIK